MYKHNGKNVPRVSEIISKCISNEYLVDWANRLGRNGVDNQDVLESAASIGSCAHKLIENSINYIIDDINIDGTNRNKAINAFNGFEKWWSDINRNNKVNVLAQEHKMTCPLFGGTLDILLSINGLIYLFDFKTSNNVLYKHFLQLSAYKYLLSLDGFELDGCGVILLDKNIPSYEEIIMHFKYPVQRDYIDKCELTFINMAKNYANLVNIEKDFRLVF